MSIQTVLAEATASGSSGVHERWPEQPQPLPGCRGWLPLLLRRSKAEQATVRGPPVLREERRAPS